MHTNQPKPFVIPIFLPHAGCPHQCVFCNQRAITGAHRPFSTEDARAEVERYLAFPRKSTGQTIISFYGGNFLGIARSRIQDLLFLAADYVGQGRADGIRFSTRPDTIDAQSLSLLDSHPVKTVELGVQSMDARVLELSKRGHTTRDTVAAARLLREQSYEVGLQMMVGLPGDEGLQSLETAQRIVDLAPDFVRIYPTVVLEKSPLADLWRAGQYQALTLERAVDLCNDVSGIFYDAGIPVVRMGLAASESLDADGAVLAGPYHPAFGHLVMSARFLDKARALLRQKGISQGQVVFRVHPGSVSAMRGQQNANMQILESLLGIRPRVREDVCLERDQVALG
ncbi:MAG: radical SAM protein [Desulfatibacillum sp.]|nr:radical SAM protein [Desulfatibacillum sp.]